MAKIIIWSQAQQEAVPLGEVCRESGAILNLLKRGFEETKADNIDNAALGLDKAIKGLRAPLGMSTPPGTLEDARRDYLSKVRAVRTHALVLEDELTRKLMFEEDGCRWPV